MPAINPPKYSKKEVSQRFNLKELLGYEPSEEQKRLFYELAVDRMVERTLRGKDINNEDFTPYSPEYADRKGVSVNSVDMTLTGEMLSSFEESQKQKNVVKIKLAEGDETLKGFNHNVGDTLPKRQFFGLLDERSINSIKKEVDRAKRQERQEEERQERTTLLDIREALRSISITAEGFNGEN